MYLFDKSYHHLNANICFIYDHYRRNEGKELSAKINLESQVRELTYLVAGLQKTNDPLRLPKSLKPLLGPMKSHRPLTNIL